MNEQENLCVLCPRRCRAARPRSLKNFTGKVPGVCSSPRNPVLARAALHMWEEPVISGERGSGTVFFSGCNLKCVFCQNYGISTENRGEEISVERLKEIYRELISAGAHNINLVTPAHYSDAVIESLSGEKLPVPVVWNSNGYDSVEVIRSLKDKVDIFLPDMKYASNELAARYSSAPDYFEVASQAVKAMYEQTGPFRFDDDGMLKSGVEIRHLILPGQIENSLKVIDFVRENFKAGEVLFSLMRQYLPCGRVSDKEFPELNRRVSEEEYKIVEDALFASGIEDGFVQDAESASQVYIPPFDGSGVIKD